MTNRFENLDFLKLRLIKTLSSSSENETNVADSIFQIIPTNNDRIRIFSSRECRFEFQAFYLFRANFYRHPFEIISQQNVSSFPACREVSLFIKSKKLRDFDEINLKNYLQSLDENLDSKSEVNDFHNLFLVFNYFIDGQHGLFHCNNSRPLHLPRLTSNPWNMINTETRFRYDAENRDGVFRCEFKFDDSNSIGSNQYKIVLCLVSNTIPIMMDNHALRWNSRLKLRTRSKQNQRNQRERCYLMNHSSGIVVANISGTDFKFNPQRSFSDRSTNFIRSDHEPDNFRFDLENAISEHNDLTIAVIKTAKYPEHMRTRRELSVRRYVPFDEIVPIDVNNHRNDSQIIVEFKNRKEDRSKQLILDESPPTGTFSQAHVRLYAAVYLEQYLLSECLSPPIRNKKNFERLTITRVVQPNFELRANNQAYVYCGHDLTKFFNDQNRCPFEFQFVFVDTDVFIDDTNLESLFDDPQLTVNAEFVPDCGALLEFTVPNQPEFDQRRVFIRLRHKKSRDHRPSSVKLNEGTTWIYHADQNSVSDFLALEAIKTIPRFCSTKNDEFIENCVLQFEESSAEFDDELSPVLRTPKIDYDSD